MTRERIMKILTDAGIEADRLVVNTLMNEINTDKGEAVEEALRTAKEEASGNLKNYVAKEEYDKILAENNNLKDASAKSERIAKYKEFGLIDKYGEFADSKLKDSKDIAKDIEEFKKSNAELFKAKVDEQPKVETPKPEPLTSVQVGNTNTSTPHAKAPSTLEEAIARHYANN